MEYTIHKLAQLAGVTTRTLRYYDEIGLLSPLRISSNGYRIYGAQEVDRLQQILFFRELGMPLEMIRGTMASKAYDGVAALEGHLVTLQERQRQLERLIATVQKTLAAAKGEIVMSDAEKFEGMKQRLIAENEERFGVEVREKYGVETVEKSNAAFAGLTEAQFAEMERLSQELAEALKRGVANNDPAGAEGQAVAELHKRWLGIAWGNYSKEAHMGVAQMYVDEPRFAAHYNAIVPGAAEYLRDAVAAYCK